MSTDFADTATTVEEFAVGAAKTAAEVAGDPVKAARHAWRRRQADAAPVQRILQDHRAHGHAAGAGKRAEPDSEWREPAGPATFAHPVCPPPRRLTARTPVSRKLKGRLAAPL